MKRIAFISLLVIDPLRLKPVIGLKEIINFFITAQNGDQIIVKILPVIVVRRSKSVTFSRYKVTQTNLVGGFFAMSHLLTPHAQKAQERYRKKPSGEYSTIAHSQNHIKIGILMQVAGS